MGVAAANAGELYIVTQDNPLDINQLAKSPNIDVYGFIGGEILVGADQQGVSALYDKGVSLTSLGPRDESKEYYFFDIKDEDIAFLDGRLEIIYKKGFRCIGRSDGPIDEDLIQYVRRLTSISFFARPVIELSGGGGNFEPLTDPEIEAIVSQVSRPSYTNYIQTMQDFGTRYSYTTNCRNAELWAQGIFSSFGYTSELFPYVYSGNTWNNVIGRKTGLLYPDSIYIFIAHLDSYSNTNPNSTAPGAEDNASGSACVLEAARVLSGVDLNCTIEFILVTGEEQGLKGSQAYAQYCSSNNRNIAGVLNFDMITYSGGMGWDTNIFTDQNFPAEVALGDLLGQTTTDYSSAIPVRVNSNGPEYGSDHYYFSLAGFPAPFSIDAQLWSSPDWYPYYHTPNDLITHLDMFFGTQVVKGAVAALATVAGLPPILTFNYPGGRPSMIDPSGGTTFRVEIVAGNETPSPGTGYLYYDAGSGYVGIPMQVVSPNVYDAVFPSITCGTAVNYYISAQSTIGTTVTDPRSAPAEAFSAVSAGAPTSVFEDDFSVNSGWTMDGSWAIGQPLGSGGEYGNPDPADDHSPSGANSVLGYNLSGDYENNMPERYATSPAIDCSQLFGVTLSFWRWLGVEQPTYDHARIRISTDGVNWTEVWSNGGTIEDNAWSLQTFDISQWADGQSNVQIRFVMGTSDGAWRYCGWNIDDLSITGFGCSPQDIPTLSEWGMLLMGLLLLAFGSAFAIRRKTALLNEAK